MDHSSPGAFPLFLRSIELAGFKSFARSTQLELPPGITALVGANGSGKSNIVDAIRWCLGEQSMRDLRGQRAEDVIHAGPRRVLGSAEVTLTFEATSDDGGPDLSLGRRLHRSGESEYLVDGGRARLRDVLGALRHIGIDGGRYVVVNQGMADALLSATPLERRALLEHAAGLSGYRAQREEARQKLSLTSQNMQTIEAVLAEMEPRLRSLRRQARAVRDRDEASERLRVRLAAWYAVRWRRLSEDAAGSRSETTRLATARQQAESELRAAEEAADSRLAAERAYAARLEAARAALHTIQRDSDAARFSARQQQDQLANARRRAQEPEDRIALIAREMDETGSALAEARVELTTIEMEQEELRVGLAAIDAESAQAKADSARLETEECTHRREKEEAERALDTLEHQKRSISEALARDQDRLAGARARWENVSTELVDAGSLLLQADADLQSALVRSDEMRETATRAKAKRDTAREGCNRLEALRIRLETQVARLKREAQATHRQIEVLGGRADMRGLCRLKVAPGWERAAAAAIGPWLGSTAHEPATWTGEERHSFLSWRSSLDVALGQGAVWADTRASLDSPDLVTALSATLFVEDESLVEEVWQRIAGLRAHRVTSPAVQVVSRSGVLRSALGVSRGQDHEYLARYLELKQEKYRLDARISERAKLLRRVSDKGASAVAELAPLEADASRTDAAAGEATRSLRFVSDGRDSVQRRVWRLEAELHASEGAVAQMEAQRAELMAHAERVEHDLSAARACAETLRVHWESSVAARVPVTRVLEDLRERSEAIRAKVTSLDARHAAQVQSIQALERARHRLAAESIRLSEEVQALSAEIDRYARESGEVALQLADLGRVLDEQLHNVASIEAARPHSHDNPVDLIALRGRLGELVGAHERAIARATNLEQELKALERDLARELGTPPESLWAPPEDVPTDDEIRRLRARASQYADADESVLREYEELDDRYTHLRRHLEDLNDATEDLRRIMETADREMNARFAESLSAVSAEFLRVFNVMLGGGEARLEQVDDEGGIGIRAQLPGRRARSSAAFSGGERTLVASCLLFGVLKIRPTPFCVLDEVDAALDESNVDRYLAALRDIGQRTQIIVVTHNRATMAAADVLYGVTMDQEGVSSLLSLRLEEYEPAV